MTLRTATSERWIRGWVGDVAVVDTRRPLLFWEEGRPVPSYAVPDADVLRDYLEPGRPGPDDPFFGPRGAVNETYDVVAGDRRLAHAAWARDDPALAGHVVYSWKPGVFDRWTEEEEEVFAHPRDPFSRVDAIPSVRHVVVSVDGQVVADSTGPVLLFETGLPTRYYLPAEDVRLDLLYEVKQRSECPYKGFTDRYWDLPDLPKFAWSYADPFPAVGAIAGRVAFYNEVVDIDVDGVRQERPDTGMR